MSTRNFISLGIMTGTSLDGVDLSIIKSDGIKQYMFLGGATFKFTPDIKKSIFSILGSYKRNKEIDEIEQKYTNFVIKKVKMYIKKRNEKIDIIGFHGQTLTHKPKSNLSWQMGDAKKIFNYFKIKTIYDFRKNDINNGGNGAPLTPIFHELLKNKYNIDNAIFINLGGISNLSFISNNNIIAFDCGPCCSISDEFIKKKLNLDFDYNGKLALNGKSKYKIINKLIKHNYFMLKPPKTLDRLDIPIDEIYKLSVNDGLATINSFIVKTIEVGTYNFIKKTDTIILLGGGRKNTDLINKLKKRIKKKILIAEELGINGDLVEASAFAYLAIRSLKKLPLSFPNTTGVAKPVSGGVLIK